MCLCVVAAGFRFTEPNSNKYYPAMWDPEKAAANLIKVTNGMFKQALIQ
jgi:hypothetical protein